MGFMQINNRWPGGVIPFVFGDFPPDADIDELTWRAVVHAAMLDWSTKTEVVFEPRTDETDYIEFQYIPGAQGCRSPVGNEGGRNVVHCRAASWVFMTHELGHTLGFHHEHQRPGRDSFVVVDPEAAKADPYDIRTVTPGVDLVAGDYDCQSVSHYLPDDKIAPRSGGCAAIGSVEGASLGDIATVRAAYGTTPASGLLGPQSAISRGTNQLDVFVRWVNNKIQTATWTDAWEGWWAIGKGLAPPEAELGFSVSPASAMSRTQTSVDVFTRGLDNIVYVTTWDGSAWSAWRAVGSTSQRMLSTPMAVFRPPDTIDLFARGVDNRVYTTASHDSGLTFKSWWPIHGGIASSDVTPVARDAHALNVFILGVNNGIYTSRWSEGSDWTEWSRVLDGVALFGSSVAAVSREPNTIDLFVLGQNRGIYTAASHDGGATWHGWWRVGDGIAALGTSVTAVFRSESTLDIFVIGQDLRVWTSGWDGDGSGEWSAWRPVFDQRMAHRSAISAVSRDPSIIDVFGVGEDGRTWTAARHGSTWKGWWPVAT